LATKISAIILMIICTALTSVAQVLYKKGMSYFKLDIFSIITNYHLLSGFLLYGIGAVLMIYAFKQGEVTVLYPIIALSYIWVSLLALYFFQELMNFYKWIGIIFICIGIIAIGFGGKKSKTLKYAGVIE